MITVIWNLAVKTHPRNVFTKEYIISRSAVSSSCFLFLLWSIEEINCRHRRWVCTRTPG